MSEIGRAITAGRASGLRDRINTIREIADYVRSGMGTHDADAYDEALADGILERFLP